jgi:hypothetical protein
MVRCRYSSNGNRSLRNMDHRDHPRFAMARPPMIVPNATRADGNRTAQRDQQSESAD